MKKLIFLATFILYGIVSFSQMNYAPFLPKTFRGQDILFTSITGAPSFPYHISNAMYDEFGNILFYTVNENVLNINSTVSSDILNNGFDDITDEIIVPKPGTCNQYYIIYVNYGSPNQTSLRYAQVTVAGTTVTVAPWVNLIIENNHHGSIAVSKRLTSGDRYLFYGSPAGIRKLLITNSGISLQSLLTSTSVYSNELELNESTSWKLAWAGSTSSSNGGMGNTINVLPLTTSGNVAGAITSTTIGGTLTPLSKVCGLEFMSSTLIYAATFYSIGNPSNGIYRATLGTATAILVAGSANYSLSQVEKYGSGYCALGYTNVGGNVTLGRFINTTLSAVAGSPSINTFSADNFYFVPRGVDGENYNTILRGNEPAVTASWPANPCPGEVTTATVTNVQAGTTYTWYQKCGGTYTSLGTGTSKVLTIMSGCSYFVRAVSAGGCSSIGSPTSNVSHICDNNPDGKIAMQEDDSPAAISPNPSSGLFTIYFTDAVDYKSSDNFNLIVFDMTGKQVLQKQVNQTTKITLDMSDFPNGTYLLRIENKGKLIKTEKLIISK